MIQKKLDKNNSDMDHKYIIVTGGAGFIGSNLIKDLNSLGHDKIVIVDTLGNDDRWKNLLGKKFYDIVDIDKAFDWLKDKQDTIKAIFHMGACSDTTEKNAAFLLDNNYRYSVKLAEYALNHNIRFIYASSAATYGDGLRGFTDDHDFLEELQPLNMYGFSKHLFDLWLKNQGVLNQVVGLKFFNVYGPNECHKGRMSSVIKKFLPDALYKGKIQLFKSIDPKFSHGGQKRDFIYIRDLSKMTLKFLDNNVGGIFNIGRGIASEWNELAEAIFNSINKKPNIEYIEMPEDLIGKYQNYTCADVSKLKNVLGNYSECDQLENSVCDYVQNFLIPEKKW